MTSTSSLPPPSIPSLGGQDTQMSPLSAPTNPNSTEKHMVHWFRKGLRMHDNPSLREGLKGCTTFRCVFILDPWFAGSSNVGINKWRFLLQCLEDLDINLRKLNSRLFVIRGQPADILPKLFKEWKTTCLTFEEDPEPFGKVRDQNIMTLCRELNIEVIARVSHTLYDLDQIIEKNGGKTPLTYHQFQSIVAKMDSPSPAEAPVTPLLVRQATTPLRDDHDEKYGVPTLEELGFDIEGLLPPTWKGGETEAMRRLERHLERKAWVASFGRPKMTPQSLLASQTGLSPFLRFGCLSTRLFYHDLNKLYKRIKKAPPPLSLHGQLLWREFFYCAATRNPNFDRMLGNPICVQIPWDVNMEALAKWANAQTGFPWIDAIMTQLREEGWIHHLARHAVACFLTRGDLWVSWEEGMKIFDELLLDADWSVNAGMWMWLSCSSFFQQFFHCYCPVKFGRKADPNGDFIRRYLPVLKNVPTRYIHEPWMAPLSVQKASKCVVGVDYPLPMVNHPVVSKINIERIKQVYRQLANYKGNKKCVKPKSPEAMTIEAYASQVTPPSLACTDANSPLPSPVTPHAGDLSPQVINTDVIQYPPCCYNEQTGGYEKVGMGSGGYSQYTTGQTEWDGGKGRKPGPGQGKGKTIHQGGGKPMAVSDGKQMPCPPQISGKPINQGGGEPMNISQMGDGKPMNMSQIGGKPMSVSSIGGKPVNISQMRGKPMNASQMGGKPMNTSQIGGKPMAVSYMGGKPMDISQMGGKPMSSQISGKPMSSQMGGKPMNTSQIGGKPLSVSRGKPMSQLSQQMKPPPTTMDDQLNSDYLDITQVHLTNQMSPDYPMPRADLTKSCADSNIRYADGTMSNGDGTMACADSNIRYADGTMANDMTNGDGTDENSYTDGPMSCADGNMSCSDSNIRFADPNMSNGDGTDEPITYADGNMSYSDGNMSCADSNAMCSDMGSMDPPQSAPRGRMSYGAMVGARETEEQMLNEESTVIEIADSIITESEEREKMK